MKTLPEFDYKKATQAINYLAKKEGGQIDKLKLIKLVYFADRFHLRRYGRPITNDEYIAMPLGPVGSSVKDVAEFSNFLPDDERKYATIYLKNNGVANAITSVADVDVDVFSRSEKAALDFVYSEFGDKQASTLVNIAHRYPEWGKFKQTLESKETTRQTMSYSDFFKNPDNGAEDKFALPNEVLEASQELFEEDYKVAEYWR